jgi:hypothetical protein
VKTGEEFTLFNVYAPCDSSRQQALWHNIAMRLNTLPDHIVCVCGDFNTVRSMEERKSVGGAIPHAGSAYFNHFIGDNVLVDLPLQGHNLLGFGEMGSL